MYRAIPLFDISNFVPALPPKKKTGKQWTRAELDYPKVKECKFCNCRLKHAHWQRMHMCKACYDSKKYMRRLF